MLLPGGFEGKRLDRLHCQLARLQQGLLSTCVSDDALAELSVARWTLQSLGETCRMALSQSWCFYDARLRAFVNDPGTDLPARRQESAP